MAGQRDALADTVTLTIHGDVAVGNQPMDGCFSADNRSLLIANQGDGSLSLIDRSPLALKRTTWHGC
jgi:hypothetical protein